MSEKHSIELQATPEDSLNLLFEQYKEELADPLLNKIKTEIERSWNSSNSENQEVLIRFKEFVGIEDYDKNIRLKKITE